MLWHDWLASRLGKVHALELRSKAMHAACVCVRKLWRGVGFKNLMCRGAWELYKFGEFPTFYILQFHHFQKFQDFPDFTRMKTQPHSYSHLHIYIHDSIVQGGETQSDRLVFPVFPIYKANKAANTININYNDHR